MSITEQERVGAHDRDFMAWLLSPEGGNCIKAKDYGDGVYAAVKRLLFHYTIIIGCVGDRMGCEDRYCYETEAGAQAALEASGNDYHSGFEGWHRHPATGRRRPDGDKSKEYIAW